MRSAVNAVAAGALVLAAHAAPADELPHRAAGLWETVFGGHTMRECVGDASDQLGKTMFKGKCDRHVTKTSTGYEMEGTCTMGVITIQGKTTLTGDMGSGVKIEGTSTMTGIPGRPGPVTHHMEYTSRRVGPCEAGQKPGDIVMPNGTVMHMPLPASQ